MAPQVNQCSDLPKNLSLICRLFPGHRASSPYQLRIGTAFRLTLSDPELAAGLALASSGSAIRKSPLLRISDHSLFWTGR
jgi:hypothetical protein